MLFRGRNGFQSSTLVFRMPCKHLKAYPTERRYATKISAPAISWFTKEVYFVTDPGSAYDESAVGRSTTSDYPASLTPRYSAHEVRLGKQTSRKTDVFSLGCVFYGILSTLWPLAFARRSCSAQHVLE